MFWKTVVDAELSRSLGLTMKKIEPILAVGGDVAGAYGRLMGLNW